MTALLRDEVDGEGFRELSGFIASPSQGEAGPEFPDLASLPDRDGGLWLADLQALDNDIMPDEDKREQYKCVASYPIPQWSEGQGGSRERGVA